MFAKAKLRFYIRTRMEQILFQLEDVEERLQNERLMEETKEALRCYKSFLEAEAKAIEKNYSSYLSIVDRKN